MEGTDDDSVQGEDPHEWCVDKWLFSSDHWELLNVFSLGQIKCGRWEWMSVFSTVTLHPPPPSQSIIYYGTGSLMFNPPQDTPFSHIFTNDFLMTLFLKKHPPTPLFNTV
jgi:hypothetical protein